jgi:hypothetical protein
VNKSIKSIKQGGDKTVANKPKWAEVRARLDYLESKQFDPTWQQPYVEHKQFKLPVYFQNNPDRLMYGTLDWKVYKYDIQYQVNDGIISRPLTTLEAKTKLLISEWSKLDRIESKYAYDFEYACRHHPLLIAKSGFGGIAHELYNDNKPTFRIVKLGLSSDFKPIAIVQHTGRTCHVDISPLFVGLSINKRKKLLKYNKQDNEFNSKVYKFVASQINTLYTYKRD